MSDVGIGPDELNPASLDFVSLDDTATVEAIVEDDAGNIIGNHERPGSRHRG